MKKLTILLIAGDLDPKDLGGAEVHIVEVIAGLAKLGHHLHVFVGHDDSIKNRLNHKNITIHAVRYRRLKNLYSFSYMLAVYRQAKKFIASGQTKIDLIHAKQVFPFGFPAARLARKFNLPLYITVQNPLSYREELVIKSKLIPNFIKSRLQNSLQPFIKYAFRRCHMAACVSQYSAHHSQRLGAKKAVVVPNGFDSELFYSKPNLPKNEIWLTTTSTLIPRNGVDTLIKAFALIHEKFPNAKLKIAGVGPMKDELDQIIKNNHLESKVDFLGTLTHQQIPALLNQSHLFIRPSRFEGFGVSFIEAMACKIPVIACPSGGIVDFITHQKTGFLVPADHPVELARAMEYVLKNPAQVKPVIDSAYKLVMDHYTWPQIIAKVDELYYTVMEN